MSAATTAMHPQTTADLRPTHPDHEEEEEDDDESYESGSYISGSEDEEDDGVSVYSDHHLPPQSTMSTAPTVPMDAYARPLTMDELRELNAESAHTVVDDSQGHVRHASRASKASLAKSTSIRNSMEATARSSRTMTNTSVDLIADKPEANLIQESIIMDSVDLNNVHEDEADHLGPLVGSPPYTQHPSPFPALATFNTSIMGNLANGGGHHGRFEHLAYALNRQSPRPTPSPNRHRQRAASTSTTASTRARHHAHFPTDTLPNLPQSMIPPAIVPVTPPSFSAAPGEDVHEWLFDYTLAARNNHWPPTTMLSCVGVYLTGTAQQWYRYAGHRHAQWDDFAAALLDAFTSPTRAQQYFVRLQARKQGADEPVRSYAHDVLLLCYLWNPEMEERERVRWVRDGLRREFWEDVILQQGGKGQGGFQTVRELLECVETTEDLQGLTRVYEGLGKLAQRDRLADSIIGEVGKFVVSATGMGGESSSDPMEKLAMEDGARPIASTGNPANASVTSRFARWRNAVSGSKSGSGSGAALTELVYQAPA